MLQFLMQSKNSKKSSQKTGFLALRAFVVVKWLFAGGFRALTLPLQIWSNISNILTRGSTLGNKNIP